MATSLPSSALYMFLLAYFVVPLSLHVPSVSILPEKPAFSIYCRVDLIEKGAGPETRLSIEVSENCESTFHLQGPSIHVL